MWRFVKHLIRSLTRRKRFNSKSCFSQNPFLSKSCLIEKFFIQKHASWKNFIFKIVLSEVARTTKICAFYWVNWIKTWLFVCKKFFETCFLKLFFSSKSCFSKNISFFKINLLKFIFLFKIWRVVNFSVQNLTRCKDFNSESDTLWKIFAELWFYLVFRGLIDWWFLLSTLIPTYFKSGEVKDNACFWFSRQMYNWKLPHVSSLLNVWGIAKWQHTIFTEPMEKTLWSIKSSRSAVFLKIHICESKENAL